MQENAYTLLGNTNINPTMRHVCYINDEWKKDNFSSVYEPFNLQEKIGVYN